MPDPLPIDPFLPEIVARVRERRSAVITAAPGAGKTTRIPPALAGDGPVIVLQPRRMAARALAARVAGERGWTLGREVGWHVRLERRFSAGTQILFATEGILAARLQQDPLISVFRTVVLDEFHERSIHADVAIALARQAWLARDDLRLVVMSATMNASRVAAYLHDAPILDIPGRQHPLEVRYEPGGSLDSVVRRALGESRGQVLCFLPGAPEIRRAEAAVRAALGPEVAVVPLHGSLPAAMQDEAIADAAHRRVILATNIAETSLTVPGVHTVIDSGQHKVARYDPQRAIDSLDVERITQDAADQRAGRAARLGPGIAWRLWPAADRLRPHREPEIARIDLAGPLLDVLAWGGDPAAFDWFEAPAPERIAAGMRLLEHLGACRGTRLTELGRAMHRLPLHPRLARILLACGGAREAALACALLSERHLVPAPPATTSCDLLAALDPPGPLPPHVLRTAAELERLAGRRGAHVDDTALRRALLAGYPDRVAKRRGPMSPRVLLASGHGAVVGPQSGVRDGEYLLALDVTAAPLRQGGDALIRMASIVDRDWLASTRREAFHEFDARSGTVRAVEREYYGAVVLSERPLAPDRHETARLLAEAYLARARPPADERLIRRLRFAGLQVDEPSLVRDAAAAARSLAEIDLATALSWRTRQDLDRLAPDRLPLPSGRTALLNYLEDGSVSAEVKLQELFGLAETPRVGERQEPVLISLLAPNGRPVQLTRDLRSFWERTYPEVRRELRGRYPKHPWPEDPWTAQPTARTRRNRS